MTATSPIHTMNHGPAPDVVSDVLRTIRIAGALFLNGEFRAPWCVDAPPGIHFASVLCPGAKQLAILHLVLEGRCWIRLRDGEAIALEAGDVATMPHGDAHLIGSGLRHAPVELDHVVQVRLPELSLVRYGGDGERTVVVCGWFAYERDVQNPLIAALPRLFRTALRERPAGAWLEQSVRYALAEAASGTPGSGAAASKVAESLFVEALRGHIDALPPQQSGWLAGLRDPQIGRCLALMHDRPAQAWSVESLAQALHMSRSALAERFNALVGVPPMQYLKQWRLAMAARLLCSDGSKLLRIAETVGYETEASLSRAFKAQYGVSPGGWRSARRGEAVEPAAAGVRRTAP